MGMEVTQLPNMATVHLTCAAAVGTKKTDLPQRSKSSKKAPPPWLAHASEEGPPEPLEITTDNLIPNYIPPCELLVPRGRSYMPFQRQGILFALAHRHTLIADEMGLGKTIQAIGVLNQLEDVRRVLIVCPKSLRINWINELKRWSVKFRLFDIVSYNKLGEVTDSYDLAILDEAHYIKTSDSQRSIAARKVLRRAKRILMLTGTPVENRPVELWPLVQILDPETFDPPGVANGIPVERSGMGGGARNFVRRYCDAKMKGQVVRPGKGRPGGYRKVFDVGGASNIEELGDALRATCMIRRQKRDVLKDLPPKRRQIIIYEAPDRAIIENEAKWFAKAGLDYESDVAALTKANISFPELAEARVKTGKLKAPYVVEHIEEMLRNGIEKVVVFAHHKEIVWAYDDALSIYGSVVYTGDCTEEMRDKAVRKFQTQAETRIFIGSHKAAGVGLTLTAASHMVIAEMDWKPMVQAEDRIHRIGQSEPVLIQIPVFDMSVDSNMAKLIVKKMNMADGILEED
jgi:SNF2 family DNA or RNA helicase